MIFLDFGFILLTFIAHSPAPYIMCNVIFCSRYGDMVVKTKRARCFIMFWMVVCQILTSLIVGALSSAFTTVVIQDVSLYGKKVMIFLLIDICLL